MAEGDREILLRLRIIGAWSGLLQVPVQRWSVADLRGEVSRATGFEPDSINMISGGRNLKDPDFLKDLNLKDNSKVLLTRTGRQQAAAIIMEKERADRLERIRAAAEAMSRRAGSGSFFDDYELEVQNQRGDRVDLKSDSAKRAVMMGMILSAQAQKLIKKLQYKQALDLLLLAEESYSIGDEDLLKVADNVALVQIDIVWCLFMLQEIGGLGVAQDRLAKARAGLQRAHGQGMERLHALQGDVCPELAIYVRLELLQGVVAYHSGCHDAARKSLEAALEKAKKLDVSDESLAMLVALGYKPEQSKRALRIAQDVQSAETFLMEQKRKKQQRRQEDKRFREERREQKKYGKTVSGKAVDMNQLNAVAAIGYERPLVAEALKQADNDGNTALEMLSNPAMFEALQTAVHASSSLNESSSQRKRTVPESELLELAQMGFDSQRAALVLANCRDLSEALEILVAGGGASSSNATSTAAEDEDPMTREEAGPGERDAEMEDEIARDISGDPVEDYDIGDVVMEREAIQRYLAMLNSEHLGT